MFLCEREVVMPGLWAICITFLAGWGQLAPTEDTTTSIMSRDWFDLRASAMYQDSDDGMDDGADGSVSSSLPDGFFTGLRDGFEKFPRPLDSPLYFEDPFINTDIRPIILHHEFPESSLLGGGDLTILAVQARLAVTDRLAIIATADGHADLEADALPQDEGYNDLAAGIKYAFYVNKEKMSIMSAGLRWRLSNGSRGLFQGIEDEISVFVNGAKQYDKLYVIANLTGRLTTHGSQGNDSVSWNVNASYKVTETFSPLIEYHGFLYTSNGNRLNVRDGLLDYGNLGAADVRGSMAHWGMLGFRWEVKPGVSFGMGYGTRLRNDNDIYDRRIVANLVFTF